MEPALGSEINLVYQGAPQRSQQETVIFVHNMLGDTRSVLRHSRMMNDLGYDTVSFDLIWGSKNLDSLKHPLAMSIYRSIFHVWKQQILQVFDQVSGPKILYGFSGPSLAGFLASEGRTDISKVICDGGPFYDFKGNTKNLFQTRLGIPYERPLITLAHWATYIWGPPSERALAKCLNRWSQAVPILSIRGGKDPIVPEVTIEKAFTGHAQLPLTRLSISEGRHLDGLKNFSTLYKDAIVRFLEHPGSPKV